MNRHHRLASLALLATLGACQTEVALAAKWLVQPILGPVGSTTNHEYLQATGLNNSGMVVGRQGNDEIAAFVTGANGVGFQSLGKMYGVYVGVDDAGEVSSISGQNGVGVFITPPNSLTLNSIPLLPGADQNYISAMSSDGRIVGRNGRWVTYSQTVWGQIFFTGPHGVGITEWLKPNELYDLKITGINNANEIVGDRTIRTDSATGIATTMVVLTGPDATGYRELGTLGGEGSSSVGVNNSGQVAGTSQLAAGQANQHAFLTSPHGAVMKDLGDLGGGRSAAKGLNNLGQVVGSSYTTASSLETAAFITGPNGVGMRNLTQEVWLPDNVPLREAVAINDKGQVLVNDVNNKQYLLTPVPDLPVGTCAVTYKVTYTGLGLFTAKVTVSNQGASAQSDWAVTWHYNLRPLLVASNAKIALDGTAISATPTSSNKSIKAQSTVSFTLTGGTKGGKAPSVSFMEASLGGKSCTATVQ